MWSQRAVIDYGLARRAALARLVAGGPPAREDLCDAHPYLLRAARHFGDATGRACPVCALAPLHHVRYAFGDALGTTSGRVRTSAELHRLAREHHEFRVYVVEVCLRCGWNHLVQSFVLGTALTEPRAGSREGRARRGGTTVPSSR